MRSPKRRSLLVPGTGEVPIPDPLLQAARRLAAATFRTDFDQPGYALLDFGVRQTPAVFRRLTLDLAAALDAVYRESFGLSLQLRSANQFDQQVTTKPHLDGGPAESILLLGYEATGVDSQIYLADYSRCARDQGLTPQEFLDRVNPTFGPGPELLRPYTFQVTPWQPAHYQILLVNNSTSPWEQRQRGMLGLMHHAVIARPDPTQTRRVNSLMLTPAPPDAPPRFTTAQIQDFLDHLTPLTS